MLIVGLTICLLVIYMFIDEMVTGEGKSIKLRKIGAIQ
jgi:hypothetical protein